MYRIIPPEEQCNTARMWRVTHNGALVAMFLSRADAMEYAERKGQSR